MNSLIENLIPLTAIVATFGSPVLIVFFIVYFRYRQRLERMSLAREYLSKGLPVPPELFGSSGVVIDPTGFKDLRKSSGSDLRKGFRLAFIGLGVTLAFYVSFPHSTTWGWGLIPMVMGIGFIISGLFEKRQASSPDSTKPTPPSGNPL